MLFSRTAKSESHFVSHLNQIAEDNNKSRKVISLFVSNLRPQQEHYHYQKVKIT